MCPRRAAGRRLRIGGRSTNRGEFTRARILARSSGPSLFDGVTVTTGSGVVRGFLVAVALGIPTRIAAVRVGTSAAIRAR